MAEDQPVNNFVPPPPPTRFCDVCGDGVYRSEAICYDCRRRREELAALRSAWRRDCPARYRDARFNLQDLGKRVLDPRAVDVARTALAAHTVLVLMGPSGIGKTTLACATAAAWIDERREAAAFVTSFDLATARSETRLGGTPDAVHDARRSPLLIIDDVGNEALHPTSSLVEVLFHRHEHELPLIVTAGIGRKQLAERYGAGAARRLLEQACVVEMKQPRDG